MPTLSDLLSSPSDAENFCRTLHTNGYAIFTLPETAAADLKALRDGAQTFFALPSETKSKVVGDDTHTGGEGVGYRDKPDHETEFLETFLTAAGAAYPPSIDEPLATAAAKVHQLLSDAARRLLEIIAAHIKLPASALIDEPLALWHPDALPEGDAYAVGSSLLRLCHYHRASEEAASPPQEEAKVLFAAHTDSTLLTLSPIGDPSSPGLELLLRKPKSQGGDVWFSVESDASPSGLDVEVHAGDYLDILSRGYFQAMRHRVVRPSPGTQARLSSPLLLRPRDEWRRNRGWIVTLAKIEAEEEADEDSSEEEEEGEEEAAAVVEVVDADAPAVVEPEPAPLLLDLNTDLLHSIVLHLNSPFDFCRASRTCSVLRAIVNTDSLWMEMAKKRGYKDAGRFEGHYAAHLFRVAWGFEQDQILSEISRTCELDKVIVAPQPVAQTLSVGASSEPVVCQSSSLGHHLDRRRDGREHVHLELVVLKLFSRFHHLDLIDWLHTCEAIHRPEHCLAVVWALRAMTCRHPMHALGTTATPFWSAPVPPALQSHAYVVRWATWSNLRDCRGFRARDDLHNCTVLLSEIWEGCADYDELGDPSGWSVLRRGVKDDVQWIRVSPTMQI